MSPRLADRFFTTKPPERNLLETCSTFCNISKLCASESGLWLGYMLWRQLFIPALSNSFKTGVCAQNILQPLLFIRKGNPTVSLRPKAVEVLRVQPGLA